MVRIQIGSEEITVHWDEWEQRVAEGRVPADALVCIDALTHGKFVPAHTLESWTSLRRLEEGAFRRAVVAGGPPVVTALLVGAQVRLWWTLWWPGTEDRLVDKLTCYAPLVLEQGQSWRLLTMGFLHKDYDHLAMNMLWLAYTGWNIERALGWRNLVLIYVGAVVTGSVFSMTMAPWRASLGASGGVFGLVAACVVFGLSRPELLPPAGRRTYGFALLPYLLWTFWNGLQSETTDNWAHFGGIVAGSVLAVLLDPESLPRRPGWNTKVRVGLLALLLGAFTAPPLLGPRAIELVPSEVAAWEALRREDPLVPMPDAPAYRSIEWKVPVGWERDTTLSGDVAFCSTVGSRCFGTRERREVGPATLDDLQQRWLAAVGRGHPDDVTVVSTTETTVAGWPGRLVVVKLPRAVIEWRATVRGRYGFEVVWQVEADREADLAPLRDRLLANVVWRDPGPVYDARAMLALAPKSRATRQRWAEVRAEIGEVNEAAADLRALIDEVPADPQPWILLIELARAEPGAVPDARALWSGALAAHPTPKMVVAVAASLDARGEPAIARGLIDLAWGRNPGDGTLKRARTHRGLPVALEPTRHLPWDAVYDAISGDPWGEDVTTAWLATPLEFAAAEQRGADLASREARWVTVVPTLPVDALLAALVRAKTGAPANPDAALLGVREDLKALRQGRRPPWVSEPLGALLTARMSVDPELAERAR